MTNHTKPTNLQEFFDAYDKGNLHKAQVELPPLEEHSAEASVLLALWQDPNLLVSTQEAFLEAPSEGTQGQLGSHWSQWLKQWRWWLSVPLAGALVTASLLLVMPFSLNEHVLGRQEGKEGFLIPKSGRFTKVKIPKKRASLFIGCWNPSNKHFKRLGSGEGCQQDQSLLFGFSLIKKGGFVYLLRLREGTTKPTMFYPFARHQRRRRAPGKLHLIRDKESLQEYQLSQESGRVTFVLLQTKRPLRDAQERQLILLSQKQSLKQAIVKLKDQLVSSDRFVVRVETRR